MKLRKDDKVKKIEMKAVKDWWVKSINNFDLTIHYQPINFFRFTTIEQPYDKAGGISELLTIIDYLWIGPGGDLFNVFEDMDKSYEIEEIFQDSVMPWKEMSGRYRDCHGLTVEEKEVKRLEKEAGYSWKTLVQNMEDVAMFVSNKVLKSDENVAAVMEEAIHERKN